MDFKNSLDKYLTTPPDDGFDNWSEEVLADRITDAFYSENEKWIEQERGYCNKWLNDLFYKRNKSPEEGARIIERAYRFFKSTIEEEQEREQEWLDAMREHDIQEKKIKQEWREKLIGLLNVEVVFEWLNTDHDNWMPIDVVEIYNVEEKNGGYSGYQHVRIKDTEDRLLYMRQTEDEEEVGVDHYCVWQTTGYECDDYSGFILFPLSDGRYFKVSYAC